VVTERDASELHDAKKRRRRAVEAACAVAGSLGIACSSPRIMKDSNNTIVHLAPAAVVAKVGTSSIRRGMPHPLERELSIAQHLARHRAPIAPPASSVPPGPHRQRSTMLTLWEFRHHVPSRRADPSMLATALQELHRALADYPGELPPFTAHVEEAGNVLSDPSRTPDLNGADRSFLQAVQRTALALVRDLDSPTQPLHGEPHLDGNCLLTAEGPVFVDLEASCTGPKEWDLTSLPKEVAARFGSVDHELLASLTLVRSLCVAAWCWKQPQRAPEVAEAAHYHLSFLRQALAS